MAQQTLQVDEAYRIITSQPSSVLWKIGHQLLNLTKRDFLAQLPIELASSILSLTDAKTLSRVARVSKVHHALSLDSSIWRILFFRKGYKVDSGLLLSSLQELYNLRTVSENIIVDDVNLTHDTSQDITYGTLEKNVNGGSTMVDTEFQPLQVKKDFIHVDGAWLSPHDAIVDWKWIYRQRLELDRNWDTPHVFDDQSGQWVVHGYRSFEFVGHEEAVYCLQFDRDKIVSGSRDDTIKIWDMDTKECIQVLNGHTGSVLCLYYNENYLVSGSSDSSIIIWSLVSGSLLKRLYGHSESVLGIKIAEELIISCSKDSSIKIWDFDSGRLVRTLNGHRTAVNAVECKNGLIVSASGDRTIKIWSLATGEELRTISGHLRGIACIQFDGKLIVSGSSDQTIRVWDVQSGLLLRVLHGHTEVVRTLQFDSEKIISGSYDGTVRIWSVKTGECTSKIPHHSNSRIFKVIFNDTKIVSCLQSGLIVIYNFAHNIPHYKIYEV